MNHAIKLGTFASQQSSVFFSKPVLASISSMSSGKFEARSVHVSSTSDPKQPPSTKIDIDMEKKFTSSGKPINVMEESFGEGYATRSDEEGFGGIYGGNDNEGDAEMKIHQDPAHHDSTQGSHVAEKEKGRNQT